MHFSAFLKLQLVLLSIFINLTQGQRYTTVSPPARYYLKTKVIGQSEDCGTDKNDLWLYSHHTGAGLGDAALSPNKSSALEGYLNGTQQVFASQIGPWPLAVYWGSYQAFGLVTISIAALNGADEGYFFNDTGLQFNSTYGGWLACDWWHGVAQLFNLNGYFEDRLPNSCSKVNLLPVGV